jgi:stalled ribosome rescue protein Dom34
MGNSKKVVGVWMDYKHAVIIAAEHFAASGNFSVLEKVVCDNHDDDVFKNEKVNQSKETQELKKYFKEIAGHIDEAASIYIFGPGKSQEQFKNFLEDYQNFKNKDIELGTSDKISENQMVAKVKEHFEG